MLRHRLARSLRYGRGPRIASALRKRWLLLTQPHADIRFDGPVYLGPGFSLHIPDGGSFHVGPGVEFRRGFRAEVSGDGRITIGAGCVFTYDVVVQCSTSIEFGERVIVSQGALVVDGNHRFRDLARPIVAQGYDFRPLRLGDDVFVTTKCTVIASIGERSVIAANSVVTKDVPPFCVAAGAPAEVIEELAPASTRGGRPTAS